MERRTFLKGAFGGEIAAFTSPLARDAPVVLDVPAAPSPVAAGEHLYNAAGALVAIVTDVTVRRDTIEVEVFGGSERVVLPGLTHFVLQAEGIGAIEFHNGRLSLRG